MQTLKCSRWTMLPTARASRSYCLSFSGAFMALVYSPHAFREIGVVGGDGLRDRAAQPVEVFGAWRRRPRYLLGDVKRKAGVGADVGRLVHALKAKAALGLLPAEDRFAGDERRRIAARGDELDLRHQHPGGMLLAEENRVLHHRVHESRAEGAGEAAAFHPHQVDVRLAVDLRSAEEEDIDPPLAREVEELARALGERVRLALVQHRYAKLRVSLLTKKGPRCRNRRGRADRDVPRAADQAGDDAGKELFSGVQTYALTNSSMYRSKPSRVRAARA